MEITLYNFAKADNSTKQPTGGNSYSGDLKEPCGLLNPNIYFDFGTHTAPSYNYAYIADFGNRYYRINEWTWDGRFWIADMSVDTLASFKAGILASTQYVLRSASMYNLSVVDTLYPTIAVETLSEANVETEWANNLQSGSYIVGIINNDTGNDGAVSYYVFNHTQFKNLCNALLSNVDWLDIETSELSKNLTKAIFNPFQYIASCLWFPFAMPNGGNDVQNLKLGFWETGVVCSSYSGVSKILTYDITVPKHPQIDRGTYLSLSPYSRYELLFNPFGNIPLDTTKIIRNNTLKLFVAVDGITGIAYLYVDGAVLTFGSVASATAQLGVQVQLAQISNDILGVAGNVMSAIGGGVANAASGDFGGAISSVVSGIGNAVNSALPQVQSHGTNGNVSAFWVNPRIHATFLNLADESIAKNGRPLAKEVVLSGLSGYCLCSNSHMDTLSNATANEITQIENYMNAGFFIE